MKIKQRMKQRMQNQKATNLSLAYGYKNVLKCTNKETEGHKYMKFLICNYLWDKCIDFWTEASFKTGGRTDILVADWKVAIEVCESEDVQHALKKEYPFPILVIPTSIHFDVWFLLKELEDLSGDKQVVDFYNKKFSKNAT